MQQLISGSSVGTVSRQRLIAPASFPQQRFTLAVSPTSLPSAASVGVRPPRTVSTKKASAPAKKQPVSASARKQTVATPLSSSEAEPVGVRASRRTSAPLSARKQSVVVPVQPRGQLTVDQTVVQGGAKTGPLVTVYPNKLCTVL